jgi:hypothetical protein
MPITQLCSPGWSWRGGDVTDRQHDIIILLGIFGLAILAGLIAGIGLRFL